jgi:mycothione reductase
VRIVTKGPGLLTAQDGEISRRFTELARSKWQLHLSATVNGVRPRGSGVAVQLGDGSSVEGDLLLVATGRRPNSDLLKLQAAGVDVRDDGRIRVDEFGRTSAEGVWALGDVSSAHQLKHVANAEARTVAHNLVASQTAGTSLQPLPTMPVPSAVFTDPQVAAVGCTKEQLEAAGVPFITSTVKYGDTAFGWAMEDGDSFCRLYAHPHTRLLLGAHIMGPQAATLIQPLIYAMSLEHPCDDLIRGQYWIHPALTEVIENALLQLQEGL